MLSLKKILVKCPIHLTFFVSLQIRHSNNVVIHYDLEHTLAIVLMVVLYPTVMVTSLFLIVVFCRNKTIRSEPGRWLIMHTCLSIFVTAFFIFMSGFTTVFKMQSFDTSPLCPVTRFAEGENFEFTFDIPMLYILQKVSVELSLL